MIQRWGDYDKVKGYSDYERLPKGGYVVKILGVSVGQTGDFRKYLKLSCDIVEGEYANFYADQYKANTNEDKRWSCNLLQNLPVDDGSERDGWTKRSFRTMIDALEESNPGFHWDWNETKLKGLIVGGLFNEREYEGQDGTVKRATNLARFCAVDKIRSGNYTLPKDKLLDRHTAVQTPEGFMSIPEGVEDAGLPFN